MVTAEFIPNKGVRIDGFIKSAEIYSFIPPTF